MSVHTGYEGEERHRFSEVWRVLGQNPGNRRRWSVLRPLARATCTADKSFLSLHNHVQGHMSNRALNLYRTTLSHLCESSLMDGSLLAAGSRTHPACRMEMHCCGTVGSRRCRCSALGMSGGALARALPRSACRSVSNVKMLRALLYF